MATAPAITVTFLGTSSGVPTLQRSLACVAVQRQGELILMDCGEAAQVQYRRAGLGFAPLTTILISHLHGDHVTGLPGLLMSLQMAGRTEPLLILAPPGLEEYVHHTCRTLHARFTYAVCIVEIKDPGVIHRGHDYAIHAAWLDHRGPCLGFRLEEDPRPGRFSVDAARGLGVPPGPLYHALQHGKTIQLPDGAIVRPDQVLGPSRPGAVVAYCTDTRPCGAAIDLGRQADLLIHEATFAAGMEEEAARKAHSTAADAARVAFAAGARQLVLTHISPRYADPGPLLEQARAIFPSTRMARDLAEFHVYHREE